VAAILLSRLGNLGPVVWFLPPAAGQVLRETGIVLFLAAVGFMAGDRFLATLLDGDGLFWMACGAMVTIIPVAVVATLAHLVCRLNYLTICGLVAGGMTDPPALAFANAMAPSDAPALAYATVYPLVMCLRILSPQLLAIALLA
jgi:putative transport protein